MRKWGVKATVRKVWGGSGVGLPRNSCVAGVWTVVLWGRCSENTLSPSFVQIEESLFSQPASDCSPQDP